MPNWCSNRISITGEPQDIEAFVRATTTPEGHISVCEMLIPLPTDRPDDFGWYAWALEHWGTKWADKMSILDRGEMDILDKGGETLLLIGDTAWAPPIEGYTAASEKFPTLHFTMSWDEAGMAFLGAACIQGGRVTGIHEIGHDQYPNCNWDIDEEIVEYQERVEELRDACVTLAEAMAD